MTTTASSTGRAEPLTTLLAQLPGRLLVADVDPVLSSASVRRVTDDSRAVGADTLFVAVPGMSQDGHRYIPQAIAAGALALLSIFRHRANIERLMRGEESKIGS